jgi:hypothetical protein
VNFILAKTFTDSLAKLDTPLQAQVKAAVFDFQQSPKLPGFQFHRIDRAKDKHMWSARVNDDLRMVIHHTDDRMVFCYVAHHDDAYSWGERRRIEPNPVTGAAQFVEIKERVEEITKTIVREVVRDAALFERHERDYLLALGVPLEWLDAVHTVDMAGLEKLEPHLPAEAFERLLQLACGEPVPRPVLAPAADPYAHPDARRRFVVLDDRAEFRRALEHPWEQWLVFLHPTQRAVVQRRFQGPARVTGSAGTGKSVVAIHRAADLAKEGPPGSVLLTTYSRTLAARLAQNLALLLPDDGAKPRVQVTHLHKLAVNLWTKATGRPFNLFKGADLPGCLGDALRRASPKVGLTVPFLRAEWESVVDPWGIRTWEGYRAAPRAGRATPMGLKQRMEVWKVFDALHTIQRERHQMSWSQVCYEAAQGFGSKPPFRHVIADECQDFGPAEFTLLRSLAPLAADDLFLCGDAGQRIFRGKFTWGGLGIDVRGRSTRLKVNYRTTEQIRRFADALIPSTIDEGDGEDGTRATVSVLSGPAPESRACASVAEEVAAVAAWVKALLGDGYAAREIAVFGRTEGVLKERAMKALEAAGVGVHALDDETPLSSTEASVGTMHRAKGLEFRAVAVVGCEEGVLPLPKALEAVDDADRDAAVEQERQLLYVATTRARERLLITFSGRPSVFLLH